MPVDSSAAQHPQDLAAPAEYTAKEKWLFVGIYVVLQTVLFASLELIWNFVGKAPADREDIRVALLKPLIMGVLSGATMALVHLKLQNKRLARHVPHSTRAADPMPSR